MIRVLVLLSSSVACASCSCSKPPTAQPATSEADNIHDLSITIRGKPDAVDEVASVVKGETIAISGSYRLNDGGVPRPISVQIVDRSRGGKEIIANSGSLNYKEPVDGMVAFSGSIAAPVNSGKYFIKACYSSDVISERELTVTLE